MIEIQIQKKLKSASGEMTLNLDCEIKKGSLVTLYGPSGSGKTTTLRILAGLIKPDEGAILFDGITWYNKNTFLPPQKRKIGFVFQDYALFPNMTIMENLKFAFDKNGHPNELANLVDMMELGKLVDRKPSEISGGQQQRVALARALAGKPELLLLDEPLSALDFKIRVKLQDYIIKIHKELKITTVLVSHDLGEIMKLSDQVLMLEEGKLVRQGKPEELFFNQNMSGKFKFTGEIIELKKQGFIYIATVLIQENTVKVVLTESDIKEIKLGDKVVVVSKAFNPMIYKVK